MDKDGSTPLVFACESGHEDVANVLLLGGASPVHQDKQGLTPLHYAVWSQEQELALTIIASCQDNCNTANDKGIIQPNVIVHHAPRLMKVACLPYVFQHLLLGLNLG